MSQVSPCVLVLSTSYPGMLVDMGMFGRRALKVWCSFHAECYFRQPWPVSVVSSKVLNCPANTGARRQVRALDVSEFGVSR